MSNNLKVNSKTQILEFKRKHNQVVDNLPSEEDLAVISRYEKVYINNLPESFLTQFFDDTNFKITLKKEDLSKNWENLYSYFNSEGRSMLSSSTIKYKGTTFSIDYYNGQTNLAYTNSTNKVMFPAKSGGANYDKKYFSYNVTSDLEDSIEWTLTEEGYNKIKVPLIKDLMFFYGFTLLDDDNKIKELILSSAGTKLFYHEVKLHCVWTYEGEEREGDIYVRAISNMSDEITSSNGLYYLLQTFGKNVVISGKIFFIPDNYTGIRKPDFSTSDKGYCMFSYYRFNNYGGYDLSLSYPGATTINAQFYEKDTIDLTTGEIAQRVNKLSNVTVTYVSDTITEL